MVELLIVMIILVVLAGLTIPNFAPTYNQLQLKETANKISYIMRYAQSRAVTKERDHRLEFNPDYSKYWITKNDKNPDQDSDDNFQRIASRLGRSFGIPEGIDIDSTKQLINFYKDGRVDKVKIFVCHKDRCFTVSTQEQSGYVQIFESRLNEFD